MTPDKIVEVNISIFNGCVSRTCSPIVLVIVWSFAKKSDS